MKATFNSVRQAQQARDALLENGVPETQLELAEFSGASGVWVPSDPTPAATGLMQQNVSLEVNTTLPSREFSSSQTADPTLSGALIGSGTQGYNSVDSEMQNADFNRNELDAGLYQITLDLEQSSLNSDETKQILERFGGRIGE